MTRTLLTGACVLALGLTVATGPARAGVNGDCKLPNGVLVQDNKGDFEKAWKIFASANTNKGGGNGGEIVGFFGCITGIDGPDAENAINIDANDLPGFIATDPGNSDQDLIP